MSVSSSGGESSTLRRYIDGWLDHKEKRKYQRYWFVLKGKVNTSAQLERAFLFCFKDQNTHDKNQFVGSHEINFPGGSVTLQKAGEASKSKFTFRILFNNTKFNFRAIDDLTRERWIYAFCDLVGRQFPPSELPSESNHIRHLSSAFTSSVRRPRTEGFLAPQSSTTLTTVFNNNEKTNSSEMSPSLSRASIMRSGKPFDQGNPSAKTQNAIKNFLSRTTLDATSRGKQVNQNISWYYPRITRLQAEEMLITEPVGTFLLRDSESYVGNFTLTFRDIDKIKNHMILSQDNGSYKFSETEIQQTFASPSEAVLCYINAKSSSLLSPRPFVRHSGEVQASLQSLNDVYLQNNEINSNESLDFRKKEMRSEKRKISQNETTKTEEQNEFYSVNNNGYKFNNTSLQAAKNNNLVRRSPQSIEDNLSDSLYLESDEFSDVLHTVIVEKSPAEKNSDQCENESEGKKNSDLSDNESQDFYVDMAESYNSITSDPLSNCPGDKISCETPNNLTADSFTKSDNGTTTLPIAASARKISLVISEIDTKNYSDSKHEDLSENGSLKSDYTYIDMSSVSDLSSDALNLKSTMLSKKNSSDILPTLPERKFSVDAQVIPPARKLSHDLQGINPARKTSRDGPAINSTGRRTSNDISYLSSTFGRKVSEVKISSPILESMEIKETTKNEIGPGTIDHSYIEIGPNAANSSYMDIEPAVSLHSGKENGLLASPKLARNLKSSIKIPAPKLDLKDDAERNLLETNPPNLPPPRKNPLSNTFVTKGRSMTLNLPPNRTASNKYVNILDTTLRSPTSPQSDDQLPLQTSRRLPNAPFSSENFFLKTDHLPIDESKTSADISTKNQQVPFNPTADTQLPPLPPRTAKPRLLQSKPS